MEQQRRRGSRVEFVALVGALVAVAVVAAILGGLGQSGVQGGPTGAPSGSHTSAPPFASIGAEDVVDPRVVDRGWVQEPITEDGDLYIRAALAAAGTFDTQLADRDEWVAWLKTWFTPSPLYDNEQDALSQMKRYQAELDQAVVFPPSMWDGLAREDGRVTAHVAGQIDYLELPETAEKKMWTATADLVMTYTRAAPNGEVSYDETVRVSVQVVCDGQSVPTPHSAQRAGDCKVVRFFDEAVG